MGFRQRSWDEEEEMRGECEDEEEVKMRFTHEPMVMMI